MGPLAYCCVLCLCATLDGGARTNYADLIARIEHWSVQENVDSHELDLWWQTYRAHLPFREGERVLFLFREQPERPVTSVDWLGDFNDWQASPVFRGKRVGKTDLWYLEARFPSDARLDYKLVLDGSEWILDPENPRQQVGGYGPNSVLVMPDYVEEPLVTPQPQALAGQLVDGRIHARILGYDVAYRVYLPAGYDQAENLPSLYVMDGHEYANPEMGAMVQVLDNLIGLGRLQPLLVVFVDPRDPKTEDNRRMSEYGDHYAVYSRFLCDELVPTIDATYKTRRDPSQRAMMGTSLGGLFSAYTLHAHHALFQLAGIHSPAFGYDARRSGMARLDGPVLRQWQERMPSNGRAYVLSGTISDTQDVAVRFVALARERGIQVRYHEVHEGHSWGNWRTHIDDTLLHLFGSN